MKCKCDCNKAPVLTDDEMSATEAISKVLFKIISAVSKQVDKHDDDEESARRAAEAYMIAKEMSEAIVRNRDAVEEAISLLTSLSKSSKSGKKSFLEKKDSDE